VATAGFIAALSAWTACSDNLPAACKSDPATTLRSATSISACATVSTNAVTQDEARALGFPVDDDMARLAQPIDVPFHRSDFACGTTAATSGQLRITVSVDAIQHYVNRPNGPGVDPSSCLDWLAYQARIDLQTDEGSLSGGGSGKIIAGADSSGTHTMSVTFAARPADFSGSLGIRADRRRQPAGTVYVTTTFRGPDVSGQVFTVVAYCDGEAPDGDQGDGLFWPPENASNPCGWLEWSTPWGEMMTLDEFNAL
jgi:hypothetical protein